MPTLAYLRVSKDTQDVTHQRLAILEFARRERLIVDEFIEVSVSCRRSLKERKVDLLLARSRRLCAPGERAMRCPRCQFDNPLTMHFCVECEARLERCCPQCGAGSTRR
jgi:hypothetical protein